MDVATFLYVVIFVELEYTLCDKSMTLPCDLQVGGKLLWVCVLFFNLHYRVIFSPNVKFLPCMYWSIYFIY